MTLLLLLILASEVLTPAFDARIVMTIALTLGLLALTVVNVWLYNRVEAALKQRVLQMAALSEISKELFLTLNQEQVYKLLLDRAYDAVRAQSGAILLHEAVAEPQLIARRNATQLTTSTLLTLDSYHEAMAQRRPVVQGQTPTNGATFTQGMRTRMLVPIQRDKDLVAMMVLETRRANGFSEDDFSFARQLAAQAGIVIENARMFDWFQESRNRLQVILDSMTEAVIVFGTDGKIALANPTVAMLLGLTPNLLIGETVDRLLHRPDLNIAKKLGFTPDALRVLFRDSLTLTSGARHTYDIHLNDETAYVDRTITPIIGYSGRTEGFVLVFSDVTEAHHATQTREDLTRMIVHDLRSPLAALNASMKLLSEIGGKDSGDIVPIIQRTADTSQRALRKMLHMVNSLLDIAKMENGNLVLDRDFHHLRPMAEAVRSEMMPLADELDIQIVVDVTQDLPALKIEGDKIERVMLNLLDNALKYSPVGSTITVRGRQTDGDAVRIEVIDNGPGIPDDQKDAVFERFRQVDSGQRGRRTGTGLGLSFCRMAVRAHGGHIWVEDNPDGGSIFVFTLPAAIIAMQDER
jgi:PAS domain S-box-containing protein